METTIPVSNMNSRNVPVSNVPPRTVPVTNVPSSTVPTTKVVTDQSRRHLTRFFHYISFLTLLAALVLSIIAIVKDDLTKMSLTTPTYNFNEYCGWYNVHSYQSAPLNTGSLLKTSYQSYCTKNNGACHAESIGKGWFSVLIIGIAFAGFALIIFVLDFSFPLTFVSTFVFELIAFCCFLTDSLLWGIAGVCQKACHRLQFVGSDVTHCSSKLGISWILVVIAGGLTLISMISLLISRSIVNKRY